MTGVELVGVLGALLSAIISYDAVYTRRSDRRAEALKALSAAVMATEERMAEFEKASRDPDAQFELSHVWHQASIAFRAAGDEEMSELCLIKGEYWLDPAKWADEQIDQAGIRLAELRQILHERLGRGKR